MTDNETSERPDNAPLALGEFHVDRTLQLSSGGSVRIVINATLLMLNPRDNALVQALIGAFAKYAEDVGESNLTDD